MRKTHLIGVTLIEIILSIAALALIAGITIPIAQSFQNRNTGGVAATQLEQVLRRASALARAGVNDAQWGVSVRSGTITLFQGASYAARVTTADEDYPTAASLAISGTTEYVFAKLTGLPVGAGTTTFTTPNNNAYTVTLTAKGTATQ